MVGLLSEDTNFHSSSLHSSTLLQANAAKNFLFYRPPTAGAATAGCTDLVTGDQIFYAWGPPAGEGRSRLAWARASTSLVRQAPNASFSLIVEAEQENKGVGSDLVKFNSREENNSTSDAKSRISSPISNSQSGAPPSSSVLPQNSGSSAPPLTSIAPKRKKPRPVKYEDETPSMFPVRSSSISSTKAKIDQNTAKIEAASPNMEKALGFTVEENGASVDLVKSQPAPVLPENQPELMKLEGDLARARRGRPSPRPRWPRRWLPRPQRPRLARGGRRQPRRGEATRLAMLNQRRTKSSMDKANEKEVVVAIVGTGPSGLATAACLNRLGIANIVLEREDCSASLWRKRSYDRLKLHLAKQVCELPHMPFPSNSPKFVPRDQFIEYLDNYKSGFEIKLYCQWSVESASYDNRIGKWRIVARNTGSGEDEVYVAEFLVVASGESSEGVIPEVDGLASFGRAAMHSSECRNGREFRGKNVLVVGCGNSGMEIAHDLWSYGANTSIVAR
ncbi:hypothetical protein NL676_027863, partial [Syzygium grande]